MTNLDDGRGLGVGIPPAIPPKPLPPSERRAASLRAAALSHEHTHSNSPYPPGAMNSSSWSNKDDHGVHPRSSANSMRHQDSHLLNPSSTLHGHQPLQRMNSNESVKSTASNRLEFKSESYTDPAFFVPTSITQQMEEEFDLSGRRGKGGAGNGDSVTNTVTTMMGKAISRVVKPRKMKKSKG